MVISNHANSQETRDHSRHDHETSSSEGNDGCTAGAAKAAPRSVAAVSSFLDLRLSPGNGGVYLDLFFMFSFF